MISIDFLPGSHGNFLEFICNKFLGNVSTAQSTPFNLHGASHKKQYLEQQIFFCNHYSIYNIPLENCPVISVRINSRDLLPLQSISLLRASQDSIDADTLEHDTYNKLNTSDYKWVLDNLVTGFFTNQFLTAYNSVADPSWPNINSIEDYRNLPKKILTECNDVHNLQILQLDKDHPDCPRFILREFFKIGFKYPDRNGFIEQQRSMYYPESCQVYEFPFTSFYDFNLLLAHLTRIATWLGLQRPDRVKLLELHQEFLSRQPYQNSLERCTQVLNDVHNRRSCKLDKFNLLEEAYIDSQLELVYNVNIPENQANWFTHTKEIIDIVS